MAKYIGTKNGRVVVISDTVFTSDGLTTIAIPNELANVPDSDLIASYRVKDGKLVQQFVMKQAKDLKLAFVSNWRQRCGIAQYGELLCGELIKKVGDIRIFAELSTNPIGDINMIGNTPVNVVPCWKRGESIMGLVKAIKDYNPDVVLLNQEWGLFSNARHWLSLMNQLSEFRVIVIQHSVFYHKDKTICEAAMPEIIVHLEGAKQVLKEHKKISGKVYVIPHGSTPYVPGKLWNMYRSDRTFLQSGYGLRYKNFQACIEAVAILKKKYDDVFYTAIFSESEYGKLDHDIYYNELMELVKRLGVEENVAIIRGYQSDETLDAYFRTNVATVFPYFSSPEHEVFGASGAARTAMSKGIPVITSSVNHFSDVPSIKADTPEEIANALEKVFNDAAFREAQVKTQVKYIEDTSWERVGEMYIDVLTGSF